MDPKNQADTSDMQAMFGADNSIVSWSPSGEFLGQDFNAATPFSPNEFLKFCNALSSEVEWPESKQGPTPEEGSKHPDPEDQAAGQPDPHTIEQTRGELSRLRKELDYLRQEMEDIRAWLEEVSKWSESTNEILSAQEFARPSSGTCQEPDCTCQYEGDMGVRRSV